MSDIIHSILTALTPIVFVIALGWIAGRANIVPREGSAVLGAFVVKFALPISLFLASARSRPEDVLNLPYILALLIGLAGTYALAYAYGRLVAKHPPDESALQALTCSFPNMAYCGPPVLLAAVGSGALLAVVVGNLVTSLILVPITLLLLERQHHATGRKAEHELTGIVAPILQALTKPLVVLPFLGIAMALLRIPLPDLLASSAGQVGQAAGGAALFTLGLILSGISLRIDREIAFNVLVQNILQPALILVVGLLLGLRGDPLKAVFLIGVLPAASENAMLALANKTYEGKAASSVMASTIFAIVSISVGIAIVKRFG